VLASSMLIQSSRVTGPTMCSMYAEACAKGSPAALVEFAHTRALAHANTLLRAEAMRQMRALQTVQAAHQGSLGAMYTAGQSFSLAAGNVGADALTGADEGCRAGPEVLKCRVEAVVAPREGGDCLVRGVRGLTSGGNTVGCSRQKSSEGDDVGLELHFG